MLLTYLAYPRHDEPTKNLKGMYGRPSIRLQIY